MITLALLLSTAAGGAGVDVVFLPEAPEAPAVVLHIASEGARRGLAFAVMGAPAGAFTGTAADDGGTRGLGTLPQAPRGAGLVERDGALSFTVDDAGAWEDAWAALPPSKGAGALPVPGPRGLRLVVHGTVDGGPVPAVLYGAKLRVAGTAIARTSSHASSSASDVRGVVTSVGVKPPLFLEVSGTPVDRVAACQREVPSAISVVTSSLAMKLYAKGAIACAGPLAIVPVEGTKLDAKKDVPVRGLVVAR